MTRDTLDFEEAYAASLIEPLVEASEIGEADVVVGILFRDEADTIGHVCETLVRALVQLYPDKVYTHPSAICTLLRSPFQPLKNALSLA